MLTKVLKFVCPIFNQKYFSFFLVAINFHTFLIFVEKNELAAILLQKNKCIAFLLKKINLKN